MWCGMEGKRKGNEEGAAALELLLVLPVIALMMAGTALGVTNAARDYLAIRAQEEVQQEVQLALVRILDDCLMATSLKKGSNAESLRIYSGKKLVREYFVHEDSKGLRKLVENSITLPITGNHGWAMVAVNSFGFEEVDRLGRPGLYRIWLEGAGTLPGSRPYRLVTQVYLVPEGEAGGP